MPIHRLIDSRQELVVGTAAGDVTHADAEEYLDVVEGSGAFAIVLLHDQAELVARMLGVLASADRPLRLFTSPTPARRWLESLVPAQ